MGKFRFRYRNSQKKKIHSRLGCFLRDFVSSKFAEIYENSLRLPDEAKFGSERDFVKFRLCALSDLLR